MKISLLFLFFCLTTSINFAQSSDHIGAWVGKEDGSEVTMVFDKEGYVTFLAEGEEFGGKPKLNEDGEMEWLTYEVDYTAIPFAINLTRHIIYEDEEEEDSEMMFGIFEFLEDKTKIRICMNTEEEGPISEFRKEDSLVLTKAK
jgi:hypothetical protein